MSQTNKWWTNLIYLPAHNKMDLATLILRIAFGGAMIFGHGWGKLANFSERATSFSDPIGLGNETSLMLAVFAEFLCSLAVMFGIATRLALIPLIVTMLVAAFIVNFNQPFARMEKAILFLVAFLVLMITGPGKFSFDAAIAKKLQA